MSASSAAWDTPRLALINATDAADGGKRRAASEHPIHSHPVPSLVRPRLRLWGLFRSIALATKGLASFRGRRSMNGASVLVGARNLFNCRAFAPWRRKRFCRALICPINQSGKASKSRGSRVPLDQIVMLWAGANIFSHFSFYVKVPFGSRDPGLNSRAPQQTMVRRTNPCKTAGKMGQNVCPIGVARK